MWEKGSRGVERAGHAWAVHHAPRARAMHHARGACAAEGQNGVAALLLGLSEALLTNMVNPHFIAKMVRAHAVSPSAAARSDARFAPMAKVAAIGRTAAVWVEWVAPEMVVLVSSCLVAGSREANALAVVNRFAARTAEVLAAAEAAAAASAATDVDTVEVEWVDDWREYAGGYAVEVDSEGARAHRNGDPVEEEREAPVA